VAFHACVGYRLVRNPYFHEWSHSAKPDGFPDAIVRLHGTPTQNLTRVERGSADWTAGDALAAPQLAGAVRRLPGHVQSSTGGVTFGMLFDTRVPPFSDRRARRAIGYAIDRDELVRLDGGRAVASVTCQIVTSSVPGFDPYCPYTRRPAAHRPWSAPDLPRARALVAASGTRSTPVVVWTVAAEPRLRAIGAYFVRVLRSLGYHARLRVFYRDAAFYAALADPGQHQQIGLWGWIADSLSQSGFLANGFRCRSGFTPRLFCSPALDRARNRALRLQATDPTTATAVWRAVERRLVDDAAVVTYDNRRDINLTAARVQNFQYHPFLGVMFDQLWVR
jgi:peptide/nickel transport system substrate-binding protein